MIVPFDPDVMMTRITTESDAIGRKNGKGSIVAALIEVRMTSSPMAMKNHQVPGAVAQTTKMNTPAGTREIPRFVFPIRPG